MYPILVSLNIDLIWFGIVTVIAVEVGLLTPPLGISVFVIKSSLDNKNISLGDIFLGAAPFAVMMVLVLFLVVTFPILTTALL
jgi:TRAP-type mannitol/chloroaromatic compound transport system permease large subunit